MEGVVHHLRPQSQNLSHWCRGASPLQCSNPQVDRREDLPTAVVTLAVVFAAAEQLLVRVPHRQCGTALSLTCFLFAKTPGWAPMGVGVRRQPGMSLRLSHAACLMTQWA